MKYFHVIRKDFRDMQYVLAEGVVLGETLKVGDVFNTAQRYARVQKNLKIIWELRPNMLVESVDTQLKVEDIEIGQTHLQSAEPGTGCRLVLKGLDNIRKHDIILIMDKPPKELPKK